VLDDPGSLPPNRPLSPMRAAAWRSRLVREFDGELSPRRVGRARYVALAATLALVLGVAAPSMGAGTLIRGIFDGPSGPDTSQAQSLVSTPVGDGRIATLWQAPEHNGGRCEFLAFAPEGAVTAPPGAANGGGNCTSSPAATAATDAIAPVLGAFFSWVRNADGSVTTVVGGSARPDSHISRLELQSASGITALPFAHRHYIVSLPGAPDVGQLPAAGRPFAIVGYDSKGKAVTTIDLDQLAGEPTQ
jgi:hypothetical protein